MEFGANRLQKSILIHVHRPTTLSHVSQLLVLNRYGRTKYQLPSPVGFFGNRFWIRFSEHAVVHIYKEIWRTCDSTKTSHSTTKNSTTKNSGQKKGPLETFDDA